MNIPAFYRYFAIFKQLLLQFINVKYWSIADLQGRTGTDGEKVLIDSYYAYGLYPNAKIYGLKLVWSSTALKSTHNGVTVHSSTVPWDGTQAALAAYHAKEGETDPSGAGCWVAQYSELYAQFAGAVGDGSVDDTAAYTTLAAIGEDIYTGKGTFKITAGIVLANGQSLLGSSPSKSQILVSGDAFDAFTLSSNYASIKNVRIYSGSARASGTFVTISSATHDNVIADFDMQTGFIGIAITAAATSTFIQRGRIASLTAGTGIGIKIAGGNDTFISDLLINTAGAEPLAGINIQKTDAVWLTDIDIINSGTPILVNPDSALGQNVAAIFASQVACDKSDGSAFKISPKGTAIVKWIFLDNCWMSTCDRGLHIEAEAGATVDGVFLNGGTVYNNVKHGAFIDSAAGTIKNIFIDGSRVGGNSTTASGAYAGIEFGNNIIGFGVCDTRSAVHGQLTNKQSYGILIGTGCNDYTMLGNRLNSNVTGGMLDNSAGTSTIRNVENNNGHITRKNANSAITAGNTSVTVSHGMVGTPKTVICTPQANLGGADFWVNNIGATTFDIRISAAQAGSVTFSWEARVY